MAALEPQLDKELGQDSALSPDTRQDARSQGDAHQLELGAYEKMSQASKSQQSNVVREDTYGDSQENRFYRSDLEKAKFVLLFQSLEFSRMGARAANIQRKLSKTCQWLYEHNEYVAWMDDSQSHDHHGFLWLKGRPGVGKSTMIKAARQHARSMVGGKQNNIVLGYFFNSRGPNELENSSLGLYRELTHQLIAQVPALAKIFVETFSNKELDGMIDPWTVDELQVFLLDVLTQMKSLRLFLFIDALDEGQFDDVQQMIHFLEGMAQHALSLDIPLKICYSSRHYPGIASRRGRSIRIEDQPEHGEDLELFVTSKLLAELRHLSLEVCERAHGIFLWAVLVIPILNEIYERDQDLEVTRQQLDRCPEELHDLFEQILHRNDIKIRSSDERDKYNRTCICLLQWSLFSTRPLSPRELFLAVNFSLAPSPLDVTMLLDASDDHVSEFLLKHSKGLVVFSNASSPVQFIHDSVSNFLLCQVDSKSREDEFSPAAGHCQLRDGCFRFINLIVGQTPRDSLGQSLHVWFSRNTSESMTEISFLEYASTNMLYHTDKAQQNGAEQAEFMKSSLQISRASSNAPVRWVMARNCFEVFEARRYQPKTPILYIMAETNLLSLAETLILRCEVDVNQEGGRFGNALQAACVNGDCEMVKMLIQCGANVNAKCGEYKHALCAAIRSKDIKIMDLLYDNGACLEEAQLEMALNSVISDGDRRGLQFLLKTGVDINHVFKSSLPATTIIDMVCRQGQPELLNCLLSESCCQLLASSSLIEVLNLALSLEGTPVIETTARVLESRHRAVEPLKRSDFPMAELSDNEKFFQSTWKNAAPQTRDLLVEFVVANMNRDDQSKDIDIFANAFEVIPLASELSSWQTRMEDEIINPESEASEAVLGKQPFSKEDGHIVPALHCLCLRASSAFYNHMIAKKEYPKLSVDLLKSSINNLQLWEGVIEANFLDGTRTGLPTLCSTSTDLLLDCLESLQSLFHAAQQNVASGTVSSTTMTSLLCELDSLHAQVVQVYERDTAQTWQELFPGTLGEVSEQSVAPPDMVINDMLNTTTNLMKLVPSLEIANYPSILENIPKHKNVNPAQVNDGCSVWKMRIRENYTRAPQHLVERLGRANWDSFCRLRDLPSHSDTVNSVRATNPDIAIKTRFVRPSSTRKTVSIFRDSAIGMSRPTKSSMASTVLSHAAPWSTLGTTPQHFNKMPNPPEQIEAGEPFICPLCLTRLVDVRNRHQWNLHVFDDIKPYVCLAETCSEEFQVFPTRIAWLAHEMESHELQNDPSWHYSESKNNNRAKNQVVPRDIRQNIPWSCKICIDFKSVSRVHFLDHVCRHMENLAIGILPQSMYDDFSDDGASSTASSSLSSNSVVPGRKRSAPALTRGEYAVNAKKKNVHLFKARNASKRNVMFQDRSKMMLVDKKDRLYPCVFHHFGCLGEFPNKNEWKGHVVAQHLQLGFYRCDLGGCNIDRRYSYDSTTGQHEDEILKIYNDFHRKDFFTQHIRRMHGPTRDPNLCSTPSPYLNKKSNSGIFTLHPTKEDEQRFENSIDSIRRRCWQIRRKAPSRLTCGFCTEVFDAQYFSNLDGKSTSGGTLTQGPIEMRSADEKAFEARMEHVGRHYEKMNGTKENEDIDEDLVEWGLETGVLERLANGVVWLVGYDFKDKASPDLSKQFGRQRRRGEIVII